MNRRNTGIFLAIYGISGGLFLSFVNYFNYLNMDELKYFLIVILHPLVLVLPLSTISSLIIGIYPFAMITLGLYLVISQKKKKPRRI